MLCRSSATLFPYTTLFRSCLVEQRVERHEAPRDHENQDVKDQIRAAEPILAQQTDIERLGQTEIRIQQRLESDAHGGRGKQERRSEEHTSELQSRENLVCR